MNSDLPPPVVDTPAADAVLGQLLDVESNALDMLRRQGQQIQMMIGEAEIRKARLLGNMAELEVRGQQVLNDVGKRLGIPEGTPWSVGPDGSVRKVPKG